MKTLFEWAPMHGIVGLVLAIVTSLLTRPWMAWESSLLLSWNVGAVFILASMAVKMYLSDAQRTLKRSQKEEPGAVISVVVVSLASIVGLIGTGYLLNNTGTMTPLQTHLHLALSMLTVITTWLLVHSYFAVLYARIYYDETGPGDDRPFAGGLEFPGAEIVDYWDFMYYSFTIAMCYQTSDVTVSTQGMRRLTIAHATVSFFFVTVNIALVVGIIQSLL